MHSKISFVRIDNEREIFLHDLDRFAESFDHKLTRLFPIWVAYCEGKPMAYCYTHAQIIAYPGVHPDISPRDFYKLCWHWVCRLKEEYGNPIVLVPPDWSPKLVEKIGLEKMNHNMYKIRD